MAVYDHIYNFASGVIVRTSMFSPKYRVEQNDPSLIGKSREWVKHVPDIHQ